MVEILECIREKYIYVVLKEVEIVGMVIVFFK